MLSCTVKSDSLQPQGLEPARLLCSRDSPGKNTGGGCHFLLQGIFPAQGSNLHFLHLLPQQAGSLPLSHLGSPNIQQVPSFPLPNLCPLPSLLHLTLSEQRKFLSDSLMRNLASLPTPVFWPGEFHGLYGGHKELDTTERLSLSCALTC